MLLCSKGIEGKELGVRIFISNKVVRFKVGKGPHPDITPDEEAWILERQKKNPFAGWVIERKKEDKPKKPKSDKGGD